MSEAEKLREAVARAIFDPGAVVGMKLPDETLTQWQCRAVGVSIHAAGFRIVPEVATGPMIEAGFEATGFAWPEKAYAAMLAAAPKVQP
jgi:hypothetical protein